MSNHLNQLSDDLAAIIKSIDPAVVRIDARRRLPATGFIWDVDGVIVTANHVVQEDENIGIGLADGSVVKATLIGRDPFNDLAVLRAEGDFTAIERANAEDIKIGHMVTAVGRPFNSIQATLGMVSAMSNGHDHHPEQPGEHKGQRGGRGHGGRGGEHGHSGEHRGGPGGRGPGRWGQRGVWQGKSKRGGWQGRMLAGGHIRTDVTMYPGFSGGPLVSAYGTVYGLNTSGFTRGASLAVPIGVIKRSVNALLVHGRVRQGYLGVRVQTAELPDAIAEEMGNNTGVLVVSIEKDGPASKGGLMVGDLIVAVGDDPIIEADELPVTLTEDLIGQDITLGVVRGGEMKVLTVTIEEQA